MGDLERAKHLMELILYSLIFFFWFPVSLIVIAHLHTLEGHGGILFLLSISFLFSFFLISCFRWTNITRSRSFEVRKKKGVFIFLFLFYLIPNTNNQGSNDLWMVLMYPINYAIEHYKSSLIINHHDCTLHSQSGICTC